MKKVIIIDHEPLTKRRIEIFYIEELLSYGIEIEFWDMSSYFHPGLSIVDHVNRDYSFMVVSLIDLENKLSALEISNCLFVIEAFNLFKYRKFFRILNHYKCYKIKLELYASTFIDTRSFWHKFKQINLRNILPIAISHLGGVLNQCYHSYYKISPFDLYISSGNNPLIDVHINHPDWEKAKKCNKDDGINIEQDYAVFCDEYFPLHPDLRYFEGIKINNLEERTQEYRALLNNFFYRLEKLYKVKVIIAAHPKANYGSEAWNGRAIYKYKTCELIKECKFVLFHSSTSISFAYIYNKPLIMITTPLYKKITTLYRYQLLTSQRLKLKIYNAAEKENITLMPLLPEIRDSYIYNYMTTSEVENRGNAEILFQTFSGL